MNLNEALGFLINNTGRDLILLLSNTFNKYDITSEQWILLKCLEEEDGISTKTLVERVRKDQGNVTRILNILEKKEYVNKAANPHDKRSTLIYLTSKGKGLVNELIPLDEKVQKLAMKDISSAEIDAFKEVLRKISINVQNNT